MTRILGLALCDLRNIRRDPILLVMVFLPLVLGLLMRFFVPLLADLCKPWIDLRTYFAFIQSFMLLFAPCFVGWVTGFLLLDERDEDILTAVAVTPLRRQGFLTYRLALPTAVGFFANLLVVPLAGLAPFSPLLLPPVAFLAAFGAPMMCMLMVSYARNKVEGLAIAKAASMILMAPFAILFVDPPWQFLAGVLPPFWLTKAFLAGTDSVSTYLLSLLGGMVSQGLMLGFLWARFRDRTN